jgi:hypothetical protein
MKVARVLSSSAVAVTGGEDIGVRVGETLRIADPVHDPETGEIIGSYPDLKVVVSEVFPRFCVAETGRGPRRPTVTINIGDEVSRVT